MNQQHPDNHRDDKDHERFLKSLRAPLPRDFAENLYQQLIQEEQEPMIHAKRIPKRTHLEIPMRMVAALVLFIAGVFMSTVWLTGNNSIRSLAPTGEPITQVDPQPELIATYGDGSADGIAFTPDGEQVVISGSRGLFLHNAEDLSRVDTLDTVPTRIVGQSEDLTRIATAENDDTLAIRDTLTGEIIQQAPRVATWYQPQFDAELERAAGIACVGEDRLDCDIFELVLWETETGERLKTISLPFEDYAYLTWKFIIKADWTEIFYASTTSGEVWHYDLWTDEQQLLITLPEEDSEGNQRDNVFSPIMDIAFSPDEQSLFVAQTQPSAYSYVGALYHYAIERDGEGQITALVDTEGAQHVMEGGTNLEIITFAEDAIYLRRDFLSEFRDADNPERLISAINYEGEYISSIANYAIFEDLFASVLYSGQILISNWRDGNHAVTSSQYSASYNMVDLSPDEAQIATGKQLYSSGTGRLWNVTAPEEPGILLGDALGRTESAVFSQDNRYLAYINSKPFDTSDIVVIDRETGETTTFESSVAPTQLVFLEGDQLLSINQRGYVAQYDISDNASTDIKTLETPASAIYQIGSSFGEQYIAQDEGRLLVGRLCENTGQCQEAGVYLWDISSEDIVARLDIPSVQTPYPIGISPDGSHLWTRQCSGTVSVEIVANCPAGYVSYLWDLEAIVNAAEAWDGEGFFSPSPEEFVLYETTRDFSNAVFSPASDDQHLIYATWNTANALTINRLDLTTGEEETLYTLEDSVYSAAFNTTGDLIAVGKEGYVELWRLPS